MNPPHFSEQELLQFEYELNALKVKLLESNQEALAQMLDDDERGGDSIDRSTAEQIKSTELRLKDRELRRLIDIDAALERLKANTFGLCTQCDEWISKTRLLANPTAQLCIECQEDKEDEERRNRAKPGLLDDPHRF